MRTDRTVLTDRAPGVELSTGRDHDVRFHRPTATGEICSDAVWEEWNELSDRVGRHVAARPQYSTGSQRLRAIRPRLPRRPLVVTVHRDGRLVALAPFAVRRYGPIRMARLMGDDLGMVGEILAEDAAAVEALWASVAARHIGVHLDEVDERDPSVRHVVDGAGWETSVNPGRAVMVVDIPKDGSGVAGLRSRGSRKRLRSTRRKFDEAGTPLSVDFLSTAEELDENWDEMAALSAAGVAEHDRTDYLAAGLGDFVRSVLRREARAGRLVVATLAVGRKTAAQLFLVRSKNTAEGWLTHYDPEFADAQPGHQMMASIVDHAREVGIERIDLGVGTNGFKEAWHTGEYRAITVTALPADAPGARRLVTVVRRLESFSVAGLVSRIRERWSTARA